MLTLISLWFLKRLKIYKNEKLENNKKDPNVVLASCRPTLPPEPGSCCRALRRQGLNVVGYGARCTFLENFDLTIYSEHHDKINIKNFLI
jgi:hypothetical protein